MDWPHIIDQIYRHVLNHVDTMMNFVGLVMIGFGLLCVAGAIYDLEQAIRNKS